jgi:4-amino-4-deoxy-L-arabinose transferase-like glycosyltransferase
MSAARRRTTLLVLGAGLLLCLPGLGNHDLWNPNEPVFAEGAREMMERGEWLLPYVNGGIYEDKPILYFWAILATAVPAGGVTPLAARLPSAVASLLTLWVVVRFARRHFDDETARYAGLALATMPVFVWEARFAQMDPMLMLFMFLCLTCFHRAREGNPARWLAASGAWAGLAFLTKGPVGLVLPGAAALLALVLDRDWAFLRRPAWVAGAAAFLAVGAPWYVAVHLAGHTGYLEEFFLRQNVERFVDPFDHAQPFYYYAIRFVSDLFPWSLFLPGVILARPREPGPARGAWHLAAVYALVTLAFFSASGAKRGVYILPLYPAYAVLVGHAWTRAARRLREGGRDRPFLFSARLAAAVLLAVGALAAAAALVPDPRLEPYAEYRPIAVVLALLFGAAGAATWAGTTRRVPSGRIPAWTFGALAGGLGAILLVAALWAVPRVDPRKSARAFSERILEHAGESAPLRAYRFWRWRSEYLFYTGRLMPILDDAREVEAFFAADEPVYLLVEEANLPELTSAITVPLYRIEEGQVGGGRIYLYSNRPPATT